jgi:hypothetical protein
MFHQKIRNPSVWLNSSFWCFSYELKHPVRFRRSCRCLTLLLSTGESFKRPDDGSRAWTRGAAISSPAQPLRSIENPRVSSTRSTTPFFYKNLAEPWSVARSCRRWRSHRSSHGATMDSWPRHCRSFNSPAYRIGVLNCGHPIQKRQSWLEQEILLLPH